MANYSLKFTPAITDADLCVRHMVNVLSCSHSSKAVCLHVKCDGDDDNDDDETEIVFVVIR